jgi:hypothetical protein
MKEEIYWLEQWLPSLSEGILAPLTPQAFLVIDQTDRQEF